MNFKAVVSGETFRSIADTAQAFLAWYDALPADEKHEAVGKLPSERGAQVLSQGKIILFCCTPPGTPKKTAVRSCG